MFRLDPRQVHVAPRIDEQQTKHQEQVEDGKSEHALCRAERVASQQLPGIDHEKCAKGQAQFTVCEESSHDWELSYGNPSKFKDALKGARNAGLSKFKALTGRGASSEVPPRTQQSDLEGVTFVFAHDDIEKYKDTSIFTPARVQAMCRAEAIVTKHPLYPLFCRVDKAGACVDQIYSPMRFFYPIDARDPASNGCSLLPQEDVDKGMADLLAGALGVGGFFLSDAAVADQKTNKTRANLLLGTPLPGFKDQDDDKPTSPRKRSQLALTSPRF